MNLTAATITIYFMGLVNFDTRMSYTAVVPLATSTPTVGPVTLERHQTNLVITKWMSGGAPMTGCAAIPGATWNNTDKTCTVLGLERQEIEVVSSEALTVQRRFNSIPMLQKKFCSPLGDLNSNGATAVKMAISNGTLDACLNVQAWIASLTVDVAASNNFKIGPTSSKTTVTLDGGAVVSVITVPTGITTSSDPEPHFFWHYYARNNHTTCSAVPSELDPVPECYECAAGIPPVPHHPDGGGAWPVATGVGCSVTQYP